MVKKFLRNIRQKPKSTRDNIALSIAGVVTALIAVVWAYHLPYRMSTTDIELATVEDEAPETGDFFLGLKEQLATVSDSELQESTSTETVSTTSLPWSRFKTATGTAATTTSTASSTDPAATSTTTATTSSYTFSSTPDPIPTSQSIRIVTVSASATAATTTDR